MTDALNPEPLLRALHAAVNAHSMQWVAGIDSDPAYTERAKAAIDGEHDRFLLRVCGLEPPGGRATWMIST